jgi:hypothetical protein
MFGIYCFVHIQLHCVTKECGRRPVVTRSAVCVLTTLTLVPWVWIPLEVWMFVRFSVYLPWHRADPPVRRILPNKKASVFPCVCESFTKNIKVCTVLYSVVPGATFRIFTSGSAVEATQPSVHLVSFFFFRSKAVKMWMWPLTSTGG